MLFILENINVLWISYKSAFDVSSCRPNTGRSPFEEEKADLLHKYNKISLPDAGENYMNIRKVIVQVSFSLESSVTALLYIFTAWL